jgi:hypothetical protein
MAYVSPQRFAGWRATARQDWPSIGANVRIGTYAAVIGAVSVGDAAMVGVQVVMRTDLAGGLAASVRPNWRTSPASGAGPAKGRPPESGAILESETPIPAGLSGQGHAD